VPRVRARLKRGPYMRALSVFTSGVLAARERAREGDSKAAGRAMETATRDAVAAMRVPERPQHDAARKGHSTVSRAEQLIMAGQVRRGAAALSSRMQEPEKAAADARAQLVEGLDQKPPLPEQPSTHPPPKMDEAELDEWSAALKKALLKTKRRSAAGPTGLPGDFLRRALLQGEGSAELLRAFAELMPHLLDSTPEWLTRSRLAVILRTKSDGRVKARAVACGEAILRLLERTAEARWGEDLLAHAAHSAAKLKDGALQAAAVLQGIAARGLPILSVDARRAYDAVSHEAILEALRESGAPPLFVRFVATTLASREYSVGGELVRPPAGRGTAQGTALGPLLFQLVNERAARIAQQAAPGALVVTYLDNLYAAARGAGTLDATAVYDAVRAQWQRDGMTMGEAFTVNCEVPDVPRADANSRILGLGVTGDPAERFDKARKLAKAASAINPLAELIVVRECAAAQVGYDAKAGAANEELAELEGELVEQLHRRAGLPEYAKQVVTLPTARGGLGLRPLAATRDAAVLRTGLTMLTGKANVLTEAAWELARQPAGRFFENFAELLKRAGYTLAQNSREVFRGEQVVVRAPSSLERAARELAGGGACPAEGGAGLSAVAALLGAGGAKPELSLDEYRAAVRLHCGSGEPSGVTQADKCPLCEEPLAGQGHHRWCPALPLEQSLQHHALRDATARWLGEADAVHVATEVGMCGGTVIADVRANTRGQRATVEVKTVDLRTKTYERKDLAQRSAELEKAIAEHYGPGVAHPLIMSAAGAYTKSTADTLAMLSALRAHAAPDLADAPPLLATLGAACARVEAASYGTWAEAAEALEVAQRLTAPARKQDAAAGTSVVSETGGTSAAPGAGVEGSGGTSRTECSGPTGRTAGAPGCARGSPNAGRRTRGGASSRRSHTSPRNHGAAAGHTQEAPGPPERPRWRRVVTDAEPTRPTGGETSAGSQAAAEGADTHTRSRVDTAPSTRHGPPEPLPPPTNRETAFLAGPRPGETAWWQRAKEPRKKRVTFSFAKGTTRESRLRS